MSYREAYLQSDNSRCQVCGRRDNLELHYIRHEKSHPEDIIILCKKCYTNMHIIELALEQGKRSYYHCSECEYPLIDYRYSDEKRVLLCPNCLNGVILDDLAPRTVLKGGTLLNKIRDYLVNDRNLDLSRENIEKRQAAELYPFKTSYFRIWERVCYELHQRGIKVLFSVEDYIDNLISIIEETPSHYDKSELQWAIRYLKLVKNPFGGAEQ